MSNFQIVITGIFVFFIIIGVIVFAGLKGSGTQTSPEIVLWGSVSEDLFNKFLGDVNLERPEPLKIRYVQKNQDTFHQDFVEALARGTGPDAIILPQELILKERDKLAVIPYASFAQRDFKNTFIQEAELYLTGEGILALPFFVDPLLMYWNRDTLSSAGIARFPKTWDEVSALSKKATIKDNASNIAQSGAALGEYRNITHAKELLAALFMQAGNPIVGFDNGAPVSLLAKDFSYSPKPAEAVLNFYTQFSNPSKELYSWNRALPQSKNFFVAGDLALYFGFASELADIRLKNPQLNFDVAPLPQSKNAAQKVTFGSMSGFAFARNSPNVAAAYSALVSLVSPAALVKWTELTRLPPVRRDMLEIKPADPYLAVFYDSALISRGWLDPSGRDTNSLFQTMVENIVSGKERVGEAVTRVSQEIDNLMPRN